MRKRLLSVSAIFFLANISILFVAAQDKSKSSKPHNLVLEITYFKGRLPASQALPAPGAKRGAWYALFRRTPDYKLAPGALPVRAVNFVSQMEGETAKIRISVFTGVKFHDKEEFVANYTIKENERAVIKELTKFGVEPFELTVVRTSPIVADLPTVVNNSDSIGVIVEPNYSTLPTFKAKLTNNSGKAVSAFTFETKLGNHPMISGMPQGKQSQPLIAPGETYETVISNDTEVAKKLLKQESDTVENLTLHILTVVFEDGSFEGKPSDAARFRAFLLGRKLFLERAVSALQTLPFSEPELNKLTEKISILSDEIDETDYQKLMTDFPMLTEKEKSTVRFCARAAIKGTKLDMLRDLREISGTTNQKNESTASSLTELKERYQNWLARLSR